MAWLIFLAFLLIPLSFYIVVLAHIPSTGSPSWDAIIKYAGGAIGGGGALMPLLRRLRSAARPSASVSGIFDFCSKSGDLSPTDWVRFYSGRPRPQEVFIMGQSLNRTFDDDKADIFVNWCKAGTRMRVLFLSPSNPELAQLRRVSEDIKHQGGLPGKIRDSYRHFQRRIVDRVLDDSQKPMARFATIDLPVQHGPGRRRNSGHTLRPLSRGT